MNPWQQDRELQMPQGETLPYAITHHPERREDADVRDGVLCLRLRAEASVVLTGEAIVFVDGAPTRVALTLRAADAHEEVWESAPIAWRQSLEYSFRLQTVTGQALLGRTGLQASLPAEARYRASGGPFPDVPDWVRGAVFYQVFPDRFSRGDADGSGLEPWEAPPTPHGFKGGTLRGVTHGLDAIAALGADAIWLNPIFSSPSNHGYDTVDFHEVEPRLGTIEDLRELTDAAHARGMRVILDGVFNHVSEEHPFFLDVVRRGQESPYWSWFTIRRWPILARSDAYYATWWGFGHLPQLDLTHPAVQDYFVDVGTRWIRDAGVDGWRLDVAGEVPLAFWQRFRAAVRRAKPDAYLLAEVWGDARPFVQGDAFDATMHYPFRRAVLEFLRGAIDARACATHLDRLYHRLPKAVAEAQYNLLGSHDVSRVRHDLGGDDALVELALHLQFAYPGVAALYYGDEVGLDGAGDPGCRAGYPWSGPIEHDLRQAVASLAALRRRESVLRTGGLRCRALDEERLEVHRFAGEEWATLVVDRRARTAVWSGTGETPSGSRDAVRRRVHE